MDQETYLNNRDKMVVKSNELIQKSRFSLSVQQQKIVLFLISQIEMHDEDFKLYTFSIPEFCKVCGIDEGNGKNYRDLKAAIKEIADKSIWVTLGDGRETLVRWVEKPYIEAKSGTICIRLDADMKPFLLQLKENFTKYELIYTLHFRSKYAIRLYELVRSIHYRELESYAREFEVDELKRIIDAETHKLYANFKNRALLPAIREINEFSDKTVTFEELKKNGGKKVSHIKLTISTKDPTDRLKVRAKIDEDLGGGQLTIW